MTDVITNAAAAPEDNPTGPEIRAPTNASLKIKSTKLYVTVVTLSTEDNNKLLGQLKTGFERTIKWNKYKSEMSDQPKNNNLNYLIDPTFNKVNRLSGLPFKNEDDRISFSKYYTPKVKIKDFNVVIDGKSFFDVPIKNFQKHMKHIWYARH